MNVPLFFSAAVMTTTLFVATAPPARADQALALPRFDSVALSKGGTVTVLPSRVQRVVIRSGDTRHSRFFVGQGGSLRIEGCAAQCPRDYRLDVEIHTPNLDAAAVSNGGQMRFAQAFAPQAAMSVAVSNGGAIDMRSLQVREITAAVDSGGAIQLGAPARLSAAVNSGGSIRYRGNPQLSMAVANGGSVERAN